MSQIQYVPPFDAWVREMKARGFEDASPYHTIERRASGRPTTFVRRLRLSKLSVVIFAERDECRSPWRVQLVGGASAKLLDDVFDTPMAGDLGVVRTLAEALKKIEEPKP
jgi:hypothetical protein